MLSAGAGKFDAFADFDAAARPKKKSARELAGDGARPGLQTAAVDHLSEYTLAIGSGSNAAGLIEDEALTQRATTRRDGLQSGRRSPRSWSAWSGRLSTRTSKESKESNSPTRGSMGSARGGERPLRQQGPSGGCYSESI